MKPEKDSELDKKPAGAWPQIGYKTKKGLVYPVGYVGKGFRISSFGHVAMNVCVKCGHENPISEAVKGVCEKCGHDVKADL